MSKLIVMENLTLDGVMQAPGRADEDPRDGFARGGWARSYEDFVKGQIVARATVDVGPLLFGRRTYEDLYRVWPKQREHPFSALLDNAPKYVASSTLAEPLPWVNSILLNGDVISRVATLKQETKKDILVMGSGVLVEALMRRGLVDQYLLLIHPLLLGSGRRLFGDAGFSAALTLVDAVTTTSGVVIATYRPVDG
jgi:dihydrofolate reductase